MLSQRIKFSLYVIENNSKIENNIVTKHSFEAELTFLNKLRKKNKAKLYAKKSKAATPRYK